MSAMNYPPIEVYKPPPMEKKNFEHIILWMLHNNEECEWSDFTNKPIELRLSTLSKYLSALKSRGYVDNFTRGRYKITSEGKKRFHELSLAKKNKRKLSYPPNIIKKKRYYDHIILWMAYNNNYCKWSDFLDAPLSINQSSLSKNLNLLMDTGFVKKEEKEYSITQSGKLEYSRMLKSYDLDRQSILEEESKRIEEITKKTLVFFERFNIKDENLQFRFINNALKLNFARVQSMLKNQEDFDKILLFLSLNHPHYYPEYVPPKDFSKKYEIERVTLDYYINEIVEKDLYPIKFFTLDTSEHKHYYFQSDSKMEKMLRNITEDHITKSTYLNKLFARPINLNSIVNGILNESCETIFNNGLRESLREFLPEYINYLAYKIETETKLIDTFDKLEGIIWQNIYEVFQSRDSEHLDYQFIGQEDIDYYLDPVILEIMEPYLASERKDSLYQKVLLLTSEKEFRKSLETLESAISSGRKDVDLKILKALTLSHLNRNEDTIEFLENEFNWSQISKENEVYAFCLFILAYSNMALGNFENSLEFAEKMSKFFPDNSLSYAINGLVHGYNYIYKLDQEKIKEDYNFEDIDYAIEIDSFDSNKARYYQLKSYFLLEVKKFDKAIETIENAIELNPKKLDLYHSKNKILLYFDRYQEVLKILDTMLKDFPENERDIKMKKASVLKKMKNFEAGLEIVEQLLDKYPEDKDLLNIKACWLQYSGKKEQALKTIQNLVKTEPNNGTYRDTYGEILMYNMEYEKAKKEFLKVIKIDPNNWYIFQTYIKLGISYKELGNLKLALKNLKKGKSFTKKCSCTTDTKQKWLAIADLFIAEIESLEDDM
jgi:tetratricopeptide (TPR) repeat protein